MIDEYWILLKIESDPQIVELKLFKKKKKIISRYNIAFQYTENGYGKLNLRFSNIVKDDRNAIL